MSLVALAMRLTLCQALMGQTLAGTSVMDSNVGDLDDLIKDGDTRHVITVATDQQEGKLDGYSYLTVDRELELVIEIAVARAVKVTVDVDGDGPQEAIEVGIAQSDEGLEMSVDVIARQVFAVMQVGTATWAELFRVFAGKPEKITVKRGAGWEKGVRFAARQIVITHNPLHEPAFGVVPAATSAFGKLIAALRAKSGPLQRYGDLLEKIIVGEQVPDWRALQVELGLSTDAAEAVGVTPLLPGEAPADAATLESDGDHLAVIAVPEEEE